MSVFTPVSLDQARAFIAGYTIGDIIDFQNIAAGVENSNFFVTTTQARYVLTIFEKIPPADLDFYMGLMHHLAERGVACPMPVADLAGTVLHTLHGKPAALVTRLPGNDIAHPAAHDCRLVGEALAQLHEAGKDFSLSMPNWRGPAWWGRYAAALMPHLPADQAALLKTELMHQQQFDALGLPRGIIHGDLFRDNILWRTDGAEHQPQMIDFYFACNEQLLFDVAVTVNDWCLDFSAYPAACLNTTNARALLEGYQNVRKFNVVERAAWPQILRAAALRTWLGRLGYHYFPRDSELTHPKDHPFSERLLRHHVEHEAANRALIS